MMTKMPRWWGVVAVVWLAPAMAVAQAVAVRVSNESLALLGGALVSLQDPSGKRVVQSLTDERGRAILRAPAGGRYRLRVDAIGYQGVVSELLDLAIDAGLERAVSLQPAPLNLSELVVASSRPVRCNLEESRGTIAARLWDEARKALTGTHLTRSRPLELEVRTFERRLDSRGRILRETTESKRAPTTRPFASADADSLSRFGFIQERADGLWFHGPDAELLLSERFLDDHCFRPARLGVDSASRVGLEFQPNRSRTVPDIAGVLWLDAKTLELRDLEFGYSGVQWPSLALQPGGRIEFVRLRNGGWIVGKWWIRMPEMRRKLLQFGQRDTVVGYREAGGSATPVGTVEASGATLVVGAVFDSLFDRPLAGAIVSIQEGAFADTTDEAGRYRIVSPGTGDYLLTINHPQFQILQLEPLHAAAQLRRGSTDTANVTTPGLATTLQRLCRVDRLDPTQALLIGRVEDSLSGQPIGNAKVVVRSEATTLGRSGAMVTVREKSNEWEIEPGPDGVFRTCGIPRGRKLEVRSLVPGRPLRLQPMPADTLTIRELRIRHPE